MALTLVVLAGLIATYFTLYISNKRDYFTNRNFRELSNYSEQISSRIENLGEAFLNAVKQTIKEKGASNAYSAVQTECPSRAEKALAKEKDSKPDIETDDERFSSALNRLVETKFTQVSVLPIPSYKNSKDQDDDLKKLKPAIRVIQEKGSFWLVFTSSNDNEARKIEFSARVNFDDLVNPLVGERMPETGKGLGHQEGFDNVLIARAGDGQVIFQQRNPELDITSLQNISFLETAEKKLQFKDLNSATGSADLYLGGLEYKVYLQPLEIHLATTDSKEEASHWVICGLVQASHFRHETWAVSYTVLVSLAFLCALVAVSWPFLKLLLIGPKDRLRLADVYLLGLSLLIGSALLSLFVLWAYTYRANQDELDQQLSVLANSFSANFEAEIEDALFEIKELGQEGELGLEFRSIAFEKGMPKEAKEVRRIQCRSRTNILEKVNASCYPYFNTVFWVGRDDGEQEIKWTVNSTTTNFHKVADRSYFKEIIRENYRTLNGERFWLEPKPSSVTGSKTVIISMPASAPVEPTAVAKTIKANHSSADLSPTKDNPDRQANVAVVVMDTNLMSLMNPVVPDGFGYRVIDNSGTVLFQSSESKDWSENFFEECDNDPTLLSMVAQRIGGSLDMNYMGRSHHLYIKPLQTFPTWSLVVFRNKQPLRALYLEIVTLAGLLFLAYALVLLIIFCVVYLIRMNSQQRREWIWPCPQFSKLYSEFLIVNLVLAVLLAVEIVFLDGRWLVLLVFLTSLAAILYLFIRPNLPGIGKLAEGLKLSQKIPYTLAYTVNLFLVFILSGVLPAVAFFKVTYNKEMKLFTLNEQVTIWKGLKERDTRIRRQYSTKREKSDPGPITNEKLSQALIQQRQHQSRDRYYDFFFNTRVSELDTPKITGSQAAANEVRNQSQDTLANLIGQIPLFSQIVEAGIFAPSRAADGSWNVDDKTANSFTLRSSSGPGHIRVISSDLRTFQSGPRLLTFDFGVALLAFFIGIPLWLYFLTQFAVRRVFLLDLNRRLFLPMTPKRLRAMNQNLFVTLCSPNLEPASLPEGEEFFRINLKKDTQSNDWFEKLTARIKTLPEKIVIENFEERLSSARMTNKKLDLLEQLLAENKTVFIVSTVSACALYEQEVATLGQNGNRSGPDITDRWANIAARFMNVQLVETGDKAGFQQLLETEKERMGSNLSDLERKKLARLMELVWEECNLRRSLQNAGREVIKQPGFDRMDLAEIFKLISDHAALFYRRLWSACTEDEKLTLTHLAEDRFLSPNDPELVTLLRKGLIVKAPDLRLMNYSFKRFVLAQASSAGLVSMEDRAKTSSSWHTLKVPLVTGFVGVVLFLFLTQKDFYNSSLTVVTGLTTGIPALFKLLSIFQGDGVSQKILSGVTNK